MSFVWCLFDVVKRCDAGSCFGSSLHKRRLYVWKKSLGELDAALAKMVRRLERAETLASAEMRVEWRAGQRTEAEKKARQVARALLSRTRVELTQARVERVRRELSAASSKLSYWVSFVPPHRVEADSEVGSAPAVASTMPVVTADNETFAGFDAVVDSLYEVMEVVPDALAERVDEIVADIVLVGLSGRAALTTAQVRRGMHLNREPTYHTIEEQEQEQEDDRALLIDAKTEMMGIVLDADSIDKRVGDLATRMIADMETQTPEQIRSVVTKGDETK